MFLYTGDMKNFVVAIFVVIFSASSNANDCYERLTANYSRDSQAFQLSEEGVDYSIERQTAQFAQSAVIALQEKLGCQFEKSAAEYKSDCKEIVPGVSMSRVCYVSTDVGYFLVSVDMLENINIVFNRFD